LLARLERSMPGAMRAVKPRRPRHDDGRYVET
jgi:hypothetical protein